MKVYAKILGLVLVGLAIQLTLAAGEKAVGDSLVSRAFTAAGSFGSLVSRAFTVSSNIDSIIVSRAFTVTSNTANIIVSRAFTVTSNSASIIVSRAFTVSSNSGSIVSRAFTAINCADGEGGLCGDCDGDDIPNECELDCGSEGGPCDIPGCGLSDDCNGNGLPDECEIDKNSPAPGGPFYCTENCDPDCNVNGIPDECETDCDGDAIPDECELADCTGELECSDCNDNGIPDGCDADCNEDGVPDDCEIADCTGELDCSDCNGNGIPDGCDIDPADPDGNGEVSGDCDGNDTPDECDIANCPLGDTSCDDCNVNEIPDGCDISSGFSEDIDPLDGVPDECVAWDGESKEDDLWSTAVNWEVNQVPGDGDPTDLESVVVAGADANVILDLNANIDSLLLDSGATLHVTDGSLVVVDPVGGFYGNMLIKGDLQIGDGRSIDADHEVTIAPGGIYHADDPNDPLLNATLGADSIRLLGGSLGEVGGAINLSGSMVLISNGDLLLEELDDDGEGGCKGGDTPPDFNSTDSADVRVAGDFVTAGCARVHNDSSQELLLGGNFDNFSINPDTNTGFNWSAGGLLMNGTSQTIEAAGEDRGPCLSGFSENFAIGTLTLSAGSTTQVVDEFDNQQDGTTACDEVLYVGVLNLEAGSELQTNGCRVYYEEWNEKGSIPGLGTDVLQIESACADIDGDGHVGPNDLAQVLGFWGPCPPEGNCLEDLDGDGDVGAPDLAILLGSWGPV